MGYVKSRGRPKRSTATPYAVKPKFKAPSTTASQRTCLIKGERESGIRMMGFRGRVPLWKDVDVYMWGGGERDCCKFQLQRRTCSVQALGSGVGEVGKVELMLWGWRHTWATKRVMMSAAPSRGVSMEKTCTSSQ